MLIEKSKKQLFVKYLKKEKNRVISWLDEKYKI